MAVVPSRLASKPSQDGEEYFQSVYRDAPIGICLVEADDRLVRVNHAFARLLGYAEKELLKIEPSRITHTNDLEIGAVCRRRIQGSLHKSISFQKRFLHKT